MGTGYDFTKIKNDIYSLRIKTILFTFYEDSVNLTVLGMPIIMYS